MIWISIHLFAFSIYLSQIPNFFIETSFVNSKRIAVRAAFTFRESIKE